MGKKVIALLCALALMVSGMALAEGEQPPAPPADGAQGNMGAPPGSRGGGSQTVSQGAAATLIDAATAVTGLQYASSGTDENALRVTGGVTALLTGATVDGISVLALTLQNGSSFVGAINAGGRGERDAGRYLYVDAHGR